MKQIIKITMIVFTMIILFNADLFSQKKPSAGDNNQKDNKYENYVEPGVIIVSAAQRGRGVYRIDIDAGLDKEGNSRSIASNEKEEVTLAALLANGSITELLNVLIKRGYKLINAYAVQEKDLTHYYIMSKEYHDDEIIEFQRKRSGQNKPQYSPEEIEQLKRAKERNQK